VACAIYESRRRSAQLRHSPWYVGLLWKMQLMYQIVHQMEWERMNEKTKEVVQTLDLRSGLVWAAGSGNAKADLTRDDFACWRILNLDHRPSELAGLCFDTKKEAPCWCCPLQPSLLGTPGQQRQLRVSSG
jgi:hypothetical protein